MARDVRASATLQEARGFSYTPAADFHYPGVASAVRPLILWVRLLPPPDGSYLVAAPGVGYGDLYFVAPGGRSYESRRFGMRVPFARRSIERSVPTLEIPAHDAQQPMYLRLALDDESRLVPMLQLMDARGLREQDFQLERLAATSLLFIGMFISLGAANILVFAFVRERSYVVYSGMMFSNALFAATYMHESSWHWLWPMLSLPDELVQVYCVIIEAVFLLAFAKTFLETRRIVPRADRFVTWFCVAVTLAALCIAQFFPSAHVFGPVGGRELFIVCCLAFLTAVFVLGLAALHAGSIPARFFVISNGSVSLVAALVAISNFVHHDTGNSGNFVALMMGQAVEGWILFGALAYRLRTVLNAHTEEQQRRLVAQAEALAQARALLETRQLAATDALTGIANRRAFDEALAREWEHSVRAGTPIALLLLDIDYFKRYNDAAGHQGGDECLRRIAGAIAAFARRPADIAARYGGEEFAVILSDTDAAAAAVIAQEVLHAVRSLALPHPDSPLGIVTISVGAAGVQPTRFDARDSLVAAADGQLYAAKAAGRNRVSSGAPVTLPVN